MSNTAKTSLIRPIDQNIIKHLSVKFSELEETRRTYFSNAELETLRRVLKQYERDCN